MYAEVLGGNGLLSIKEINGEPVVAEIGMTAQKLGSFTPFIIMLRLKCITH